MFVSLTCCSHGGQPVGWLAACAIAAPCTCVCVLVYVCIRARTHVLCGPALPDAVWHNEPYSGVLSGYCSARPHTSAPATGVHTIITLWGPATWLGCGTWTESEVVLRWFWFQARPVSFPPFSSPTCFYCSLRGIAGGGTITSVVVRLQSWRHHRPGFYRFRCEVVAVRLSCGMQSSLFCTVTVLLSGCHSMTTPAMQHCEQRNQRSGSEVATWVQMDPG